MKKLLIVLILISWTTTLSSYSADELNPAEIMEKYGNSVVLIASITNDEEIGLGSGFIVKDDGIIITNYHVVEGAYPALIKLKNGDIYEDVSVIDYNERNDIAILKIKAFALSTVKLGNSNNTKVGEKIVVIGNPRGYENTISDGLLSQIRDTEWGHKLHQISAPISPGSSGSPVFNTKGEVIGIATLSDVLGQNINFSVPINYARGMINSPVKYSLKEFSELDKEEAILGKIKAKEEIDAQKFLEKINTALFNLSFSHERIMIGFDKTLEPHLKQFSPQQYMIAPEIYSAKTLLVNTYGDLGEIYSKDKELEELKKIIMEVIQETINIVEELISAFENKDKNIYGVFYPVPLWSKARSAIDKIGMAGRKIDKDLIMTFVERLRKDHPELEENLLPWIVEKYEFKDKSKQEVIGENKKEGHIGCQFYFSTKKPIILIVFAGTPVEKSGLKRDDIILGVKDGPDFETQKDYRKFQKTTKPGDKYYFKIKRRNKIFTKKIVMN